MIDPSGEPSIYPICGTSESGLGRAHRTHVDILEDEAEKEVVVARAWTMGVAGRHLGSQTCTAHIRCTFCRSQK
jgi:hypothetical protein